MAICDSNNRLMIRRHQGRSNGCRPESCKLDVETFPEKRVALSRLHVLRLRSTLFHLRVDDKVRRTRTRTRTSKFIGSLITSLHLQPVGQDSCHSHSYQTSSISIGSSTPLLLYSSIVVPVISTSPKIFLQMLRAPTRYWNDLILERRASCSLILFRIQTGSSCFCSGAATFSVDGRKTSTHDFFGARCCILLWHMSF